MSMIIKWALTVAVSALFIGGATIGAWISIRSSRYTGRIEAGLLGVITGALVALIILISAMIGYLGVAEWHTWMFGGAR